MNLVQDLMTRELVTLKPEFDLGRAERVMFLERVRHLPVVTGNQRLLGLVTHRDLLRTLGERGLSSSATVLASEVMGTEVATISPEMTLRRALKIMIRNKFGCLPVVDSEGVLVGLLTEHDLVKFAVQLTRELDEVEGAELQGGAWSGGPSR